MAEPSRRINRIETPAIDITFRDAVKVWTVQCWREDKLYHLETGATYVILDFGIEERISHQEAELDQETQIWMPTGRVMVEIQQIDESGGGMALPMMREIADEESSVSAWVGWELDPVSPRREVRNPDVPVPEDLEPEGFGENCALCGSSEVVYHDAEGSPRCQQHIGESPRGPDDLSDEQIDAILNGDKP